MSFEFQSTLVNVGARHRISGRNIGGVRMEMNGDISVARVIITNDADLKFALTGPYEYGDPAALYAALATDLYEVAEGVLINEGAISSLDITSEYIIIDLEGSDLKFKFMPSADVTAPVEVQDHAWKITETGFTALTAAAAVWRSSMDGTLEGLATSIATETADRIAADTAIQADVDQNEADADAAIAAEASTRETNDNTIIASVDAEASSREAADTALSGRLDVLEADPTTATAVAAGDAATLSSANAYADTVAAVVQGDVDQNELDSDAADAALSGRLDVLEADPTTATAVAAVQADVDQNESDSDAADAALSARLDVLEADPTTATAVAAVQSDVDQNEVDADAAIAGEATTRANADTALSGRLDVLEADPTTQAAVDLKANKAGDTFTGDIIIDEGSGSTIKLETSDATSAGIHIEGPTGSMGYLDSTNGFGNDSLQVYSANFWVRAINGGTGNVIIDGTLTLAGTALTATFTELNQLDGVTLGTAASAATGDFATSAQGALADTAVQPAAISNIDNTSDADKPVSTAQQAALDLRALLDGSNIPGPYANDTDAGNAGVAVGGIYKHSPSGALHWRVS